MCHIVGSEESFVELDEGVAYDEPLGFDGHKEIEVYPFVGKHHAEGQQDTVHRTRCTYGWCHWHVEY